MALFVARQPIFDGRGEVFAYELLFRPGPENVFGAGDRDRASASVIEDSLRVFGFDTLTGGRHAFVNVTRQVLVEGRFRILPPSRTVVELLETVEADDEVVAACARLKADGYLLALDDFVLRPALEPLLPYADFLKIDFLETSAEARRYWLHRLDDRPVRLLAEKVEHRAHFDQALSEGFSYFQGYFLERPEMVQATELSAARREALAALAALHATPLATARLDELARGDGPLGLRLREDLARTLGVRALDTTPRQALDLLGERAFRRWATLVAFEAAGDDQPRELVATGLVRARLCESLAQACGLDADAAFLTGLLSGLDALVGRPLEALIADLRLPTEVAGALLRRDVALTPLLALAIAYERASWADVTAHAARLGVDEDQIPSLFTRSVAWAAELYPE